MAVAFSAAVWLLGLNMSTYRIFISSNLLRHLPGKLFSLVVLCGLISGCAAPTEKLSSVRAAVENAKTSAGESPVASPVQTELRAIIGGINSKANAKQGRVTAVDLADELKAFDALLAKHAGEKSDKLAQFALMRAMVYGKLLKDKATSEKMEKQLKVEFKGTKFVDQLREEEGGTEDEDQESLEVGLPFFPDFCEKDLSGQPLSVTSQRGKYVLVYFWASWCAPCLQDLPSLIEADAKYHGEGLEIIGVSLDYDRAKLDTFLSRNPGMTWPQYFDGQGWHNRISTQYGIRNMPYAVLVGAEGDILAKGLRGKALMDAVKNAFKQQSGVR